MLLPPNTTAAHHNSRSTTTRPVATPTTPALPPLSTHHPCLTDLGGNLGASHDGGEGPLGLLHGALKVVELLLQQEAGHGRGEELGHTLGGPVGAVGGPEGVVHEQVERRGQLLGEVWGRSDGWRNEKRREK